MLAIKTMRSDSADEFVQEETALRRLLALDDPHLIKAIASIKRGDTYHILFPWADGGNLRGAWKELEEKPRTGDLIGWVFKQMSGIVGAIAKIHNLPDTPDLEENGRHGDLKPENILWFRGKEGGLGNLVLADVGLTRFHDQVTRKRANQGSQGKNTYTTAASVEYAPPEAHNTKTRSRKFDNWSLGCIFLEFIIWVFGGLAEVRSFKEDREKENEDGEYYIGKRSSPTVHPQLKAYVQKLASDKRVQDYHGFFELLHPVESLFHINPDHRLDISILQEKLDKNT